MDEYGDVPIIVADLAVANEIHLATHELPADFDDVLTVALTRRDYATILLGIELSRMFFGCMMPDLWSLLERLVELRDAQKREWASGSAE